MDIMTKDTQLLGKEAISKNSDPISSNPQRVIEILNKALADEVMLSLKTRNARWGLTGARYYDLFSIYAVQYKLLNDIAEEIIMRTQMLDGKPKSSFAEILLYTRIIEQPGKNPDVLQLLADHEHVIRIFQEDSRKCSMVFEDLSTSELLVGIIHQHEKMVWILNSYLQNGSGNNVHRE